MTAPKSVFHPEYIRIMQENGWTFFVENGEQRLSIEPIRISKWDRSFLVMCMTELTKAIVARYGK